MLCPECGMQLLDEESVCPACGMPVAPEEETRVEFAGVRSKLRKAPPARNPSVKPDAKPGTGKIAAAAKPDAEKTAVTSSSNVTSDPGPDSTQMIGSEDPTMVRVPADSDSAPAGGTEVLQFGGDYISDDPDETSQLGSDDPTIAKAAQAATPASAAPAVAATAVQVLPSEQGIVDLTPEEVIRPIESVTEPSAAESAESIEPTGDVVSVAVEPDAAPKAEALAAIPEEPPVEVEEATDLLGSEFPTSVKPAFDGASPDEPVDPDKNLRMDIDPLSGSGALAALGTLYDTGGMQFPIEGSKGRSRPGGKDILPSSTHDDQPFSRRHRKGLIAMIVIVIAALVAAGIYFFVFFGPTHAVSDDEFRGTLVHDEGFMQGRAANTYVDEDAYTISGLTVDERVADESGLTIKASVELKNLYFDEHDYVTVVYPDRHDASSYTLNVDSYEVSAIRGISRDPEYGISNANPTFDQKAQSCVVEQHRGESSSNRWWYTESGDIKLAYEFSSDTWKRTEADTSHLTSSYQHIIGPYGVSDTRFSSFDIRSVDNETGEFTGTFTWEKEGAGWFGRSTTDGSFTGRVQRDGSVEVASVNAPGTIAFTGSFGEDETLTISGTVYLDSAMSTLGFGEAPTATFENVSLVKGASMEPVETGGALGGGELSGGDYLDTDASGGISSGDEGATEEPGSDDSGEAGAPSDDSQNPTPDLQDEPSASDAPDGGSHHGGFWEIFGF